MECVLTRDDLSIQITPSPPLVSNLAKSLLGMGLMPSGGILAALDVPHPFTLTFHADEKKEKITVVGKKVALSGMDYIATNPDALARLFEADHERLLTGDIYLLWEEVPFAAEKVTEVRLDECENYSDGVTKVLYIPHRPTYLYQHYG